jgi:hypothetical protein
MRAAYLAIKMATATEIVVKIMVNSVAKLKATPGLRSRVKRRKEPMISFGAPERFSTAQFFVRKSSAQIAQASVKRR